MTASISASLHPAWVTLRPPIAQRRLSVDPDGYVWIALRHPWADGTTHLRFEPVAMLERLAALIPRPRINLVLYFVILAHRVLGGVCRLRWIGMVGCVGGRLPGR